MKYICKKCLQSHLKKRYFPSFTLFGGILGAFSSLILGPLAFIPAVVAGAATDFIKCRICERTDNLYEVKGADRLDKRIQPRVQLEQFEERESLEDDSFDFELENQQPDLSELQFILNNHDVFDYEVSFDTGNHILDIDTNFDVGDLDAGFGESGSSESGDAGGSEGGNGS